MPRKKRRFVTGLVAAAVAVVPLIYGPEYVAAELTGLPVQFPEPEAVAHDQAAEFMEDFWLWLSEVEGAEAATAITMEPIDADTWALSVDLADGPEWYATYEATLVVDQWLEFTNQSIVETDEVTGDVMFEGTAFLVSGLITNAHGHTRALFGAAIDLSGVVVNEPAHMAEIMIFVPGSFYDELEDASRMAADLVAALQVPEDGSVVDPCVDDPGLLSCKCLCASTLDLAARACAARLLAALQVCMLIAVGVFFFCWIPCSAVPLPVFQLCMVACIRTGMKWVVGTCIVSALLNSMSCINAARRAYRACLARC